MTRSEGLQGKTPVCVFMLTSLNWCSDMSHSVTMPTIIYMKKYMFSASQPCSVGFSISHLLKFCMYIFGYPMIHCGMMSCSSVLFCNELSINLED